MHDARVKLAQKQGRRARHTLELGAEANLLGRQSDPLQHVPRRHADDRPPYLTLQVKGDGTYVCVGAADSLLPARDKRRGEEDLGKEGRNDSGEERKQQASGKIRQACGRGPQPPCSFDYFFHLPFPLAGRGDRMRRRRGRGG